MIFMQQKNLNKINNKEYCREIEEILNFFKENENTNYNIEKDNSQNIGTFKNLNILYKNYFHFCILKEFYEQCKTN